MLRYCTLSHCTVECIVHTYTIYTSQYIATNLQYVTANRLALNTLINVGGGLKVVKSYNIIK